MMFQDDFILLSYVNTKLRDEYSDLTDMCNASNLDEKTVRDRLKGIGYEYNQEENKFVGVK